MNIIILCTIFTLCLIPSAYAEIDNTFQFDYKHKKYDYNEEFKVTCSSTDPSLNSFVNIYIKTHPSAPDIYRINGNELTVTLDYDKFYPSKQFYVGCSIMKDDGINLYASGQSVSFNVPEPLEFTATINDIDGSVLFEWNDPNTESFEAYSFTICFNNNVIYNVSCTEYSLSKYHNSTTVPDLVKGVEYTITLKTVTSNSSFVWTYGDDEYPILLVTIPLDTIESVIETKKNGGGCSGDCEAPTFGYNSENLPRVQHGLTLNDNVFDVEYFYTPIPMQYTEINKPNELIFKIFENYGVYNIDFVQFGTVNEIGDSVNSSEFLIEIDIGNFFNDIDNPVLESVTVHDDDNLISDPIVELSIVECGYVDADCLQGVIIWSYREVPIGKVLVLETWDNSRNSNRSYFNDGLTVINPDYIEPEIIQYKFKRIIDPIQNVMTRANSNFADIIIYEQERAVKIFNSTDITSIPLDSFAYDFSK